jgi:hypothetical protein
MRMDIYDRIDIPDIQWGRLPSLPLLFSKQSLAIGNTEFTT